MTILFVTEIMPFPQKGGEKLRSYGLLKLMSALNYTVHAILGKPGIDNDKSMDLPGITYYSFDFSYNKTASTFKRYYNLFSCNKGLIDLINSILQNNKIDVAYIDYHFYGQYIPFFQRKKIPVIYGTHNAQAALGIQRPAVSLKSKITRCTDFIFSRFHEIFFFRKANALIVVSDDDLKYHAVCNKTDKIFVIPNFLIESQYSSVSRERENNILMTANFKAFQNGYGLEWFIREVWDKELWDKTQLLLVGFGSKEIFEKLKLKYPCTNITAVGEVEDTKPFIASARASIVPLLHGSGSRLKCLESMALKTQLVSTSKGAEGIDHKNSIILADTAEEFKKALLNVIDMKTDHTGPAYKAYMDKYSLEPNKLIFVRIIRKVKS